MTEVRISIGGAEVAKWLSGLSRAKWQRPGTPVAPGVVIIGSSLPVYRELDDDAPGLPTLGDDAEVELLITRTAFPDEPPAGDTAALAAVAVTTVNATLGGLLSRVQNLRIEVTDGP